MKGAVIDPPPKEFGEHADPKYESVPIPDINANKL